MRGIKTVNITLTHPRPWCRDPIWKVKKWDWWVRIMARGLKGGLKFREWSLSVVIKTPLHLPVRCEQCCINGVRREVNEEPNCCCLKLWQEVSAHFQESNYSTRDAASAGRGLRHSSLLSELHRRSPLCPLQRCVEDTPGRRFSWQPSNVCCFH